MSGDRLENIVDELIRHWSDPARSAGPVARPYSVLAQRVTRLLPASVAARVAGSPAEHRETIEMALQRLEERDPATRDLLRPLTAGGVSVGEAPQVEADFTIPAPTATTPPPVATGVSSGPAMVFNQGSGVQVAGDFSGVVGSDNNFGAGSIVVARDIVGSTIGSPKAIESRPLPVPAAAQGPAAAAAPVLITVLFVGVNPADGAQLRLDEEVRQIDAALRQGALRDRFDLKQIWAVRMLDLQQALLQRRPQILHFSGHGSANAGIYLESDEGRSLAVSGSLLAQLLGLFSRQLRCVVLNACYSEAQARAVAQHVECVVGMSTAVGDRAAIRFSAAFYQALAYGTDVEAAFNLGCLHIQPTSPTEAHTPQLIALRCKPSEIVLTPSS